MIGYDRKSGMNYIADLVEAFNNLRVNPDKGLFNYRIILKDNEFIKEITNFFSSLHSYRKQ